MDYYSGSTDYDILGGIVGGFIILYLFIFLIAIAVSIIQVIALWKVFKKAGKGGWESLIPFYSNFVLVEVSGLNWWWFLFFFAPFVSSFIPYLSWAGWLAYLFAVFNCYYNLSKKFNKDTGFAVCLTLFTPICLPMLGFSKNNIYNTDITVSNNGVFGPSANNNNNNSYQQPVNNNMDQGQTNVNNNSMAPEFSFCGNCGTRLSKDVKFCPNCGNQKL